MPELWLLFSADVWFSHGLVPLTELGQPNVGRTKALCGGGAKAPYRRLFNIWPVAMPLQNNEIIAFLTRVSGTYWYCSTLHACKIWASGTPSPSSPCRWIGMDYFAANTTIHYKLKQNLTLSLPGKNLSAHFPLCLPQIFCFSLRLAVQCKSLQHWISSSWFILTWSKERNLWNPSLHEYMHYIMI